MAVEASGARPHDEHDIVVRTITDDEVEPYAAMFPRQFGGVTQAGEHERIRGLIPLHRVHAAFDGDEMVGTSAGYPLRLTVPGGEIGAAGLTRVSVSATHRRRGMLGRMIDAHFDVAAADGEAVSILWASEAPIYGRFGYGVATENCTISHDRRSGRIRPPEPSGPAGETDEIRYADETMARAHLPALHERVRRTVPGMFARSPEWWDLRHFVDHDWMQEATGPRRTVIAFRGGEAVGYATFRMKSSWSDNELPVGRLETGDVVAVDDRAANALWAFLANVDLFPHLQATLQSPDLPIQWWCENHRAVSRLVNDGIWLRVIDVRAALEARTYQTDGELTFELTDDRRPDQSGRWTLTVDGGAARCRRDDDPTPPAAVSPNVSPNVSPSVSPNVSMTASGLGSLYLGGIDPAWIRAGGHLTADDEAVEWLRLLFQHRGRVHCAEMF